MPPRKPISRKVRAVNVYLYPKDYDLLAALAEAEQVAMSELTRRAIREYGRHRGLQPRSRAESEP